jgi:hypothetical protein
MNRGDNKRQRHQSYNLGLSAEHHEEQTLEILSSTQVEHILSEGKELYTIKGVRNNQFSAYNNYS